MDASTEDSAYKVGSPTPDSREKVTILGGAGFLIFLAFTTPLAEWVKFAILEAFNG